MLMKLRPNNTVNAPLARCLSRLLSVSLCVCGVRSAAEFAETGSADRTSPGRKPVMRIGATQPRSRLINYRLVEPAEVLAHVDRSLGDLEQIVHRAGEAKCDALAFPEDTLGLGTWEAAHKAALNEVLPGAVERMLDRLGRAAAAHRMYLVCCNDSAEPDGTVHNTAFFLDRDGREIGRYHQVNLAIHESDRQRGDGFPVCQTSDLGGGSMIVSPRGDVLVEGQGPDDIAVAEIEPFGGREGGDAMNYQADMRARLFRERSPTAFAILTDPDPPVLAKVPGTLSIRE